MPNVSSRFLVNAPLEAVAFFHHDTRALKLLSPPPILVQIHRADPLADGSISEFTLWFGPLPIRWLAVHSQVSGENGFIDTQTRGPLKTWVHKHRWQRMDPDTTLMEEEIRYEHHAGLQGLLTRLLFAPVLLKFLLLYRKWVIRRQAPKISMGDA